MFASSLIPIKCHPMQRTGSSRPQSARQAQPAPPAQADRMATPGADGADGATGPQGFGPAGPQGETGPEGPTGPATVTIGTPNGLSLLGDALSLALAASGEPGALSGSDYDLFKASRLAQSIRDVFMFDDFDRSDRELLGDAAPTGQAWDVQGVDPTSTVIEDGLLTSPDLSYSALDYGKPITQIECTFSFVPGSGTNDATLQSLVMIADHASVGLSLMLHLLISPTTWILQKFLTAGVPVEIARGTHTLIMDGTPYHISLKIDGDTATVIAADGSTTVVTDSDITTIAPRYGCWEFNPLANAYVGRFNSIGMGRNIGRALIANGSGAPIAEVTQLKGNGISKKQTVKAVLSGGAGWYRIATASILGTFAIAGRVKVCATIPGIADQGLRVHLQMRAAFRSIGSAASSKYCVCRRHPIRQAQRRQ